MSGGDDGATVAGAFAGLLGIIVVAAAVAVALYWAHCRYIFTDSCSNSADLLPELSSSQYNVFSNPEIGIRDALDRMGEIVNLLPDPHSPKVVGFVAGLNFLTTAVDNTDDLLQCGYQTGNVSVRLYQDKGDPWSVGGALVLKGNLVDLFVDTSVCFIGKKIDEAVGLIRARWDPVSDPPAVVCDATSATLTGQRPYTVVTVATSQRMCTALTGITYDSPSIDGVLRANSNIRLNPVTGPGPLMQAPAQTRVTASCYQDGDRATVGETASSRWALVTVPAGTEDLLQHAAVDHDVTGYVSTLLLDTGGDVADLPLCTGAAGSSAASGGTSDGGTGG